MDTNEEYLNPADEPGMIITTEAQYFLRKAGKWATFLGIMGFIMTAFIAIAAFSIGPIFSKVAPMSPMGQLPAAMGSIVTVIYLLFGVLSFFFAFYLYTFGTRITKGLSYGNLEEVTSAFGRLKSFFKLWGISMIVIICFYVLAFALILVAGLGVIIMGR